MLSEHDLELLSAYLDGALSEAERTALEARLQTEPELRRELARLRATVDLIKTLPTLASPRPLTLTPRMVRRPTIWTSAAFSAMSAAAAVILLIIGAALFATSPTQQAQPANAVIARVAELPTASQAATSAKQGETGGKNAPIPTLAALEAQSDALQLSETEAATEQFLFSVQSPQQSGASQQAQNGEVQPQAQSAIVQPVPAASPQPNIAQAAPLAMSSSGAAGGAAPPELAQIPTVSPSETPSDTATLTPTNTPSPTETASLTPSETATPTPVSIIPATPETSTVGIGLIVVALLLFGAALVTSVIRRRT